MPRPRFLIKIQNEPLLTVASVAAFALGVFHLVTVSGFVLLSTLDIRIVHLMMALVIAFLTTPSLARFAQSRVDIGINVVLAGIAIAASAHLYNRWQGIALSGGGASAADIAAGFALLILVLEASRRRVGVALSLIVLVFFIYPFISTYLPGVFYSRGYSVARLTEFLTVTSEGIYGVPIGVSASYIILFTIFGAFLSEFGARDFFFTVASRLTRRLRAASAKTAVIFSALIGTISGSAAGNVAVTGSLTIPMMKRGGYAPHQAGAIEAVVSTGGQIMPPIMGAAAFIMAELIGIPYVEVMWAGLVPAFLFFASIMFVVHLQALKRGLKATPEAGEPDRKAAVEVLLSGIPFIVSFTTLIWMMVAGYSPFMACYAAIILVIATYILVHRKLDTDVIQRISRAITNGSLAVVPIAIACAAAGIIAGVLSITGLGPKVTAMIIALAGGEPFVALLFTMVMAIVLGMGLPTTAAYLILATVIAPALVRIGVPVLSAHMFVFFFGCLSTITPPVALASYVAAGIAGADINKVGLTGFLYGLSSYILPFMFYLSPAVIMQGSPLEVVWAAASGLMGVFCVAAGVIGYLRGPVAMAWRLALVIAGGVLMHVSWWSDTAGILVLAFAWFVGSRPQPNTGEQMRHG